MLDRAKLRKLLSRSFLAAAVFGAGIGLEAAQNAKAADDGSGFMVRLRGIGILPDEGLDDANFTGKADISNAYVPELDISYFFNKNFAIELILATAPHDVKVKNFNGGGTVDIADIWILPPTLLAQYHFDLGNGFKPYIGAGVNYTFFYGVDEKSGLTDVDLDDNFGFALQAGVDYRLEGNWYLNLDVKKMWLKTDASINNGALVADVDIDPWIIGLGVGYKF